MTEDEPAIIEPTASGQEVAGVPVLERDATDTRGTVTMETSDVTAWCPYEGTADFYDVTIAYLPDGYVVELMSLRDYFASYREEAIGHEEFAQRVFDHLTTLLDPAWLRLVVDCPSRYGIETTIVHDTRNGDSNDGTDTDGAGGVDDIGDADGADAVGSEDRPPSVEQG